MPTEDELIDAGLAQSDGDSRIRPEMLHAVARSRSLFDELLDLPASKAAAPVKGLQVEGPDGQMLRVLTRRIGLPGADRPYRLAIAADMSGMRREILSFNTSLLWALGLMSVFLMLTLLFQIRVGLAPLGQVRRDLAAVRSGKAERLSGNFPAEIAPLAQELNTVLDHNLAVVERARTQVGNLAHALKTPLSVLANAAPGRETNLPQMVREQTSMMRRQVDRYLALARTAASAQVLGARCAVDPVLDDIQRTLKKINQEKDIAVIRQGEHHLAVRGERADLEEIVGNLLDNAFKWASGQIRLSTYAQSGMVRILVEDDGPGLREEQWDEALKRGARLDETVPGSGLGLSIVGDMVDAYRGTVRLSRSDLGGLQVTVELPQA